MSNSDLSPAEAVAIVGLAGRFPRAHNLDEFWRNLRNGVECVSFFNAADVQWLPIEHPPKVDDPRYVKARAVLENADWFDAGFFGLNPREAAIMDPQHRVFLECAWEALEDAGCNPETYPGLIGVFAGASMNTYLFTNLLTNPELVKDFGLFSSMIMNDGDFVPTRVSYKLNLRGPSINVQTACSTSLVAVCLAAQSLLTYRSDVALAGGVSITFPPNRGQHHLEGGIMSNDGHCRAFDAKASGTVLGDGAGIVVLKRLSEAVADGDRIYAVIKGNAINNDGAVKIGYTAPSSDGQAECIAMAQAEAGIEPSSISYIEAHGTGTPLGDPIEVAGLTKAFGVKVVPGQAPAKSCVIGSVKSNIGHLDIAAGVAGLIKTVLALQHSEIPPSLHFETANPKLELEKTPFAINHALRPWPRNGQPRRAGVSSFGIGGTNAHVVLEEAPVGQPSEPSKRPQHLLVVSAKTATALEAATENLVTHLKAHPEQNIADVAYSLQTRRKAFAHRRAVVTDSREAAIAAFAEVGRGLRSAPGEAGSGVPALPQNQGGNGMPAVTSARVTTGAVADSTPTVAFMFPGQGAQSVNMGRELYETEPRFREVVDRCCEILKPRLGLDLRDVIYPGLKVGRGLRSAPGEAGSGVPVLPDEAKTLLSQTRITQPAMFVIEYALAQLWMQYGVKPNAMIGHSLGEYVAACMAGVFSLEDSLAIVAERARLMQAQPEGAMLAIRLPVDRVTPLLDASLSLAATNARGLCVVSGPFDAITALEKMLGESDVASRRLATSHAFHSAMMDGALRPLAEFIRKFERHAPQIPFISNVTGQWITAQQATDPDYWASHVRQTVRFAEGIAVLVEPGAKRVLIEVGPGETLVGLAKQEPNVMAQSAVLVASLGRAKAGASDLAAMLHAVGETWTVGVPVEWKELYAGEARKFVALPTYPFERKRFWIEPGMKFGATAKSDHIDMPLHGVGRGLRSASEETGNGLSALPTWSDGAVAPHPQAEVRASEPATLSALRGLFAELSGMDLSNASADASFYQLGFDSLFLTQASQAVCRRFNVDITFRQLRDQLQSLAKLAAYVDEAGRGRRSAPASAGNGVPVRSMGDPERRETAAPASGVLTDVGEQLIPLSDAQRELWFASQLGNEVSSAYNESSNIRLNGPLDVGALQRAFRALVARHDALRITILADGKQQRIAPTSDAALAVRDFTSVNATERERRVREFIDGEVERPFDLVKGPLFRAHLLRLEPERHMIVIVVHHIVCDGWSLGILQKDLGELYGVEVGQSAAHPPLARMSLADYAARQEAAKQAPAFAAAEEFWLKQFANDVPVLELPSDRPRPVTRSYAGAFRLHTLAADIAAPLKALGAKYECTVFTLLLAAFDVLLHRLSGQDDLVVGIPAAAQVMDGTENLVGHFANLLPVRTHLKSEQSFVDLLSDVRGQLADALEHWRYPFGRLLQRLNVARDASRMPLANVVFNSTRLRGTLTFGSLAGEVEGNAKRFSHFDLNFNFAVTGETISLGAYYSTELYDESTVARWFSHFETLLRSIVASPECPIGDLSLLTTAEREQLLVQWNDTHLPYERDATIAAMFEAQAARTPNAVAVVCGDERVTYRELNERADRIAQRLRKAGVGADTLVGVFLERSPQLLVAIYGILKAGGAYVPLDPAYPADRLEFIASDTQMPILVTQSSLVAQLPAGGFDFMLIDDESREASRLGRSLREPNQGKVVATSLAYVIYTSGSTGRPKGVAIVQRCVVALVAWARQLYQAEELDGVLFSTSASFDISVFEIFCPLCLGGKIIVADNILQLATHPNASEVRFLSGVPSALAEVVRLKIVPPSVTTVALAGETFPQPLVDALYALPHMRRVYELYGPTETTVYSTGSLRRPNTQPTLGRPFPNEQIYILDRRMQPVPIGVRGEIYIGGDKLAREYLNRPELTAEKFVPNPFQASCLLWDDKTVDAGGAGNAGANGRNYVSARLYKSGDMGKWCADGTIESLGRADHQVKIRGFRIELAEVEAVLAQHPGVAECVIIARADPTGQNRLLGYALPRAGHALESREMREHLQKHLPDYMVPSGLAVLESWPRTTNGKLDRKALPDPERQSTEGDFVAPGTTTEELLAEIWREVLGITRIGIHDNFFELGGHSLLATQVIARVHDTLEVELSIRQFFAAPTIAGLAVAIEAALIQEITTIGDAPVSGAYAAAEEQS
jgi:amino acid adenylation domain-containing protein